jgi:hypothetical protein
MTLKESTRPVEALQAGARTATVNGSGIDLWDSLSGRASEITFVLSSAAGTGTTPTLNAIIQESDDNSTFTDVATANIVEGSQFAQVTTVASFQERTVKRTKRFVRIREVIAGTTPSFTNAVVAILGTAADEPI